MAINLNLPDLNFPDLASRAVQYNARASVADFDACMANYARLARQQSLDGTPAVEAVARLRKGDVSPLELIDAAAARIAGPGGGTEQKPAGTVCIAVASADAHVVRTFAFPPGREMVKAMSANWAIDMLRRFLLRG